MPKFAIALIMVLGACGTGDAEDNTAIDSSVQEMIAAFGDCGGQASTSLTADIEAADMTADEACIAAVQALADCVTKKECTELEAGVVGSDYCQTHASTVGSACNVTVAVTYEPAEQCMGTTPFMDACTENDQCATCLCFSYNEGAQLCSKECTKDEDCEAPSPGCNNKGVCKRPK